MAAENNNKTLNVPTLRFPEFSGEWERRTIGRDCEINMCKRIFSSQTSETGDVPFYKIGTIGGEADAYISQDLFEEYKSKYNFPEKGEVLISCAGTVGKTVIYDGRPAYFQDSNIVWISNPTKLYLNEFLQYVLSRVDWRKLNTTTIVRIYNDNLRELTINFPSTAEQQKIVGLLSKLDERIAIQNKIIERLQSLIRAIREIVFSEFQNNNAADIVPIKELLDYEQPTEYLVESTEYSSDETQTPVLTANKGFILGYTDETFGIYLKGQCIIFDDFTMDSKYVDFPFKVKSSAIKILTSKNGVDLRFMFEYLQFLNFYTEEHKRHYISEVESLEIPIIDTAIQQHISTLFALLQSRLSIELNIMSRFVSQKHFLLNKMFI